MKPSLQTRQSQQLLLTPQLQQAIRLLQLSTADLEQEIERAVEQNPFLERVEPPRHDTVSLHADGSLRHERMSSPDTWPPAGSPAASAQDIGADAYRSGTARQDGDLAGHGTDAFGEHDPAATSSDERPDVTLLDSGPDGDDPWGITRSAGPPPEGDDDEPYGSSLTAAPSLREHLLDQLAEIHCDARQRALIHLLIWEVGDDGYLPAGFSLDALAEEFIASAPGSQDTDDAATAGELAPADLSAELEAALQTLQGFDPPGVAARTPGECLRLQLLHLQQDRADASHRTASAHGTPSGSPATEPSPESTDLIALALQLVSDDCLPLLARHEDALLCKRLSCSPAELRAARTLVQSLDPHPGNRFDAEPSRYIIPDIIVRRTAHGWRAEPNPSARLSLRVHDEYEALLKNHRKAAPSPAQTGRSGAEWEQQVTEDSHAESPSAPEHNLLHQLQEARTLARNVQQRGDTIVLVAQAIVDRQKAFFNHGPEALRPLVLRDIAEVVGRHESTISRATSQKYIRTPFGTFELKYFFGSQVATDSGGAASSTAVCALIQKLIEQEDTNQPLSDSQLTELLGQKGIQVARRTVAKYRESLKILPAAQRRSR
ncbi:MAG: RNA polymerase factor sigma-54 [Lautropia mirabilis]